MTKIFYESGFIFAKKNLKNFKIFGIIFDRRAYNIAKKTRTCVRVREEFVMRKRTFKLEDVRAIMREFDAETGNDTSAIRVRIAKDVDGDASVLACYRCNRLNGAPIEFVFTRGVMRCSEEFVRDIVAHEYAHYMTNTVMGHINEADLHDEVFVDNVYALGSVNVEAHMADDMVAEYIACNRK